MRHSNRGAFRDQVNFLRRQFLQDGGLPFTDVLTQQGIEQALAASDTSWLDRVFSPLVTLWVFLGQVLSGDHSCRAAVARLITEYGIAETLHFATPDAVEFRKIDLTADHYPPGADLHTPWPELYYRNLVRHFVDEIIGASFKVHNPNATSGCGCGTSFSV